VPGQEADTILGVLAPAHTPGPIIELLNREIRAVMKQPGVAERLTTLGFDAIVSTPDEFAARIKTDVLKWANVIQSANIKIE
jgi:tripartite-type tricarboxylate transporter receptor subunit TctC